MPEYGRQITSPFRFRIKYNISVGNFNTKASLCNIFDTTVYFIPKIY